MTLLLDRPNAFECEWLDRDWLPGWLIDWLQGRMSEWVWEIATYETNNQPHAAMQANVGLTRSWWASCWKAQQGRDRVGKTGVQVMQPPIRQRGYQMNINRYVLGPCWPNQTGRAVAHGAGVANLQMRTRHVNVSYKYIGHRRQHLLLKFASHFWKIAGLLNKFQSHCRDKQCTLLIFEISQLRLTGQGLQKPSAGSSGNLFASLMHLFHFSHRMMRCIIWKLSPRSKNI